MYCERILFGTMETCNGIDSVMCNFCYSSDTPYELTLKIKARGEESVTWPVDRQLMHAGLFRCVGEGDIRITPYSDRLRITLLNVEHNGECRMFFPLVQVERFINRTLKSVAFGEEKVDVDAGIRMLLSNG